MVSYLLRKNMSPARIAGFILSNFIGIAIVLGAIQFYTDAHSIWDDEDSFIKSDWLVINKKITSENTLGKDAAFSEEEIADLSAQPWVRSVGRFTAADYQIMAAVEQGNRGMSTYMFFESVPDEFIDVADSRWQYRAGSDEVPLIISKDYLTLYNFGFASSAGLPQMSEGIMSGIPLKLTLRSDDGLRTTTLNGRIAGYSNRLNTILVPRQFMEWSNREFGSGREPRPSRLAVDVSSPGDVAIAPYLEEHGWEMAGYKSVASASYLLKVVVGIVIAVGGVITLLSFFILLLSVSLLMEKNREKLHQLLMLGYSLNSVARPYSRLVTAASVAALVLALISVFLLRASYLKALEGLGAAPGFPWLAPVTGISLTILIIFSNVLAVKRKVRASWR